MCRVRGAALTCSALQDPAYSEERSRDSRALLSAKEAVSLWVLGARKVGLLSRRTGLTCFFFVLFIINFLNTLSGFSSTLVGEEVLLESGYYCQCWLIVNL